MQNVKRKTVNPWGWHRLPVTVQFETGYDFISLLLPCVSRERSPLHVGHCLKCSTEVGFQLLRWGKTSSGSEIIHFTWRYGCDSFLSWPVTKPLEGEIFSIKCAPLFILHVAKYGRYKLTWCSVTELFNLVRSPNQANKKNGQLVVEAFHWWSFACSLDQQCATNYANMNHFTFDLRSAWRVCWCVCVMYS